MQLCTQYILNLKADAEPVQDAGCAPRQGAQLTG
jgi:hypothetical protein